jgi:hypothetical protein
MILSYSSGLIENMLGNSYMSSYNLQVRMFQYMVYENKGKIRRKRIIGKLCGMKNFYLF